jgi:hypothetical protein
MKGTHMLRTIGKTFGMAIAGMCLVSTLAMAQTMTPAPGQTLVCTKIDASGNCIEAKGTDEKMMTVRVEGVKVSEKITCVTTGTNTTCTKVTVTK